MSPTIINVVDNLIKATLHFYSTRALANTADYTFILYICNIVRRDTRNARNSYITNGHKLPRA